MLAKLKQTIKTSSKLYPLLRSIRSASDPKLEQVLRGYYDVGSEPLTLLVENPKCLSTASPVYNINFGVAEKPKSEGFHMGFLSLVRHTLLGILFAERLGCVPRVVWGSSCRYYEPALSDKTDNAFLYYFEPLEGNLLSQEQLSQRPWIDSDKLQMSNIQNILTDIYNLPDAELDQLAEAYSAHIRLNEQTVQYLKENMLSDLGMVRYLGVHYRGTDFNQGFLYHPGALNIAEYIEHIKECFAKGKYEKIFLATDDIGALEKFREEFGDELVCYQDVYRSDDHVSPHGKESERPCHHYKLGLEVLRDVYTLAHCDGLVCGLSMVSFAVRYINKALGRQFSDVSVVCAEINKTIGREAKAAEQQWKKT